MSTRRSNSKRGASRPRDLVGLAVLVLVLIFVILSRSGEEQRRGQSQAPRPQTGPAFPTPASPPIPTANPLKIALEAPADIERRPGVGVAVLVDVSGSMNQPVQGADGRMRLKIDVARRSVLGLLGQCATFAKANPERNVQVGVYEFSMRDRQAACRAVIPIGPLDLAAAQGAVGNMHPGGSTPIGNAIIQAKRDLDRTGLSRLHILTVTDGENNQGYDPADVVNAMMTLPEESRASVYFIAFDIGADRFKSISDAGGLVLAAANETELQQTLDYILTGKILAEQPQVTPAKQ